MARGLKRVKGTALAKDPASPEAEDDGGRDFQFVTALARGLSVLEICAQSSRSIASGELAQITGLTLPNVSRIAYTLVQAGYLEFNGRDRTYSLGRSAEALAAAIRRRTDMGLIGRPEMEKLARTTGFSVGIATMAGDQMVYLDAFEGESVVGLKMQAGYQVPVATSAIGRAYLAGLNESEREQALALLRESYEAEEWSDLSAQIDRSIAQVAAEGYCSSFGNWNKNVNAIATSVRDLKSNILYGIVLGGPAYLLPPDALSEIVPTFLAAIDRIKSKTDTA